MYQISLFGGSFPSGNPPLTTVMVHVAILSPAVTVMVAVPTLTAVTLPLETVATPASELDHETDLLLALEGDTVALKSTDSPIAREAEVWLSVTPDTSTGLVSGLSGTGSSFWEQATIVAMTETNMSNLQTALSVLLLVSIGC